MCHEFIVSTVPALLSSPLQSIHPPTCALTYPVRIAVRQSLLASPSRAARESRMRCACPSQTAGETRRYDSQVLM
eukprot:9468137-Pyramimonas_sp.AAC.1